MTLAVTAGIAQDRQKSKESPARLDIRSLSIAPRGDSVIVSFEAEAGERAVKSNQMMRVTPVFTGGAGRTELTPIVVRGRNRGISEKRRARAANISFGDEGAVMLKKGDSYSYRESIPAGALNPETTLFFESEVMMCIYEGISSQSAVSDMVVTRTEIIPAPVTEPAVPGMTTGDMIAGGYPFVLEEDAGTDNVRDHAMTVYFKLSKYNIDGDYRNNRERLDQIIAAVNLIDGSDDSRITKVMISGFASPEGTVHGNIMLGDRRGKALKSHIIQNTNLTDDKFTMYNGASDWEGLRRMVAESDMQYRDQVIAIIDNTPVINSLGHPLRMDKLKALDGGEVYQYMLRNFFPDLRNATYIKVYYENR